MRSAIGLILAAIVAVVLAGCGEKQEAVTGAAGSAQSLTLMLDWFPNADHVGIYQALAEGDFTKADLDVHIEVPSDPSDPLKLLAAGKVDAAISYEPEVLLARNQGLPLVSVAAIVQEPLTSIVSVGSKHITNPSQLRGKRVGDAGIPYQHAYLETILARAGRAGRARSRRSTSATTWSRRCCRAGSTPRSAPTGTTRRSSSPSSTSTRT